jgi:hypothetical protein
VKQSIRIWIVILMAAGAAQAASLSELVGQQPGGGGFAICANGAVAQVFVDPGDAKLVNIAAGLLCDDIERVTGRRPELVTDAAKVTGNAIIIGTAGRGSLVDKLLDTRDLVGQWETYKIAVSGDRMVIAGSDRRGTAYGVFDLSQSIGVSPWYWWADSTPVHREAIYVRSGKVKEGPPSVKYRGIFINDEDWGLEPWAAHTFETTQGNIGPKTYAKVFELILRLRGNFLWPAMHPVSTEFGRIAENIKLADDWGIVMGASHTEAMNRNNVLWPREGTGPWRYDTNRANVLAYWEAWAKLRGPYEAVWTLGIRGVHDSAMLGPPSIPAKVKIVENAIADQRDLLRKYVNADLTKVPQLFAPYKEVLELYQQGMKVPDDVTLLWTDDNYGYIRQLSTPVEQQRSGAAGIYYHISYLGHPRSYVWLNTTPPGLIWEEMSKAYDYGANRVWVLNVGDIKPGEIGMDFWMRLGWDIHAYDRTNIPQFLVDFARREFGAELGPEIAEVLRRYYRLGFARKPEAMDADSFSIRDFDEANRRVNDYATLLKDAQGLYGRVPTEKKDAFYELVLYPVEMCALTNDVFIKAGQGDDNSADLALINKEAKYYNDTLAGGKWHDMMTAKGTTSSTWGFKWPRPENVPVGVAAVIPDYVSVEAEHFSRNIAREGAQWQTIAGLGREADAMAVYPTTTASAPAQGPELDYDFDGLPGGKLLVTVYAIPTHRIDAGRGLRYAVAIDDETPKVIDFDAAAGDNNRVWSENVIRNAVVTTTEHAVAGSGKHTLRVFMVDPGVVLEKFVVSDGPLPESELGPPEGQSR